MTIGETSLELPDDMDKEKLKPLNFLLEKANEVNDALSQMGFRNKYIQSLKLPFFKKERPFVEGVLRASFRSYTAASRLV